MDEARRQGLFGRLRSVCGGVRERPMTEEEVERAHDKAASEPRCSRPGCSEPVRDNLDGDDLCQKHCDEWVRGERPDPEPRYSMPAAQFLAQARNAERSMVNFLGDLAEQGWTRDELGAWTHPDWPGTTVMEG